MTTLTPVEDTDTLTEQQTEDQWSVLLWNDPINPMSVVAVALQNIFGYSREKANTVAQSFSVVAIR